MPHPVVDDGTTGWGDMPGSTNLEVERQLSRNGSRGDVMRSAESGEEVVQHVIVGEVNEVDLGAPLVAIALEEIVGSEGKVEEAARLDALRIVIVILSSGRRDVDEC